MRGIKPQDIKPDSIEKVVCEAMASKRSVPMDRDTTEIMVGFMMDPESREKAEQIISKVWTAQAICERMKGQFDRSMDPRAAIILASWAQSIGACVLYMYYCQYMALKKNIPGEFTMNHLVEVFPMGFISEEDLHEVWDSQKVDNSRENFAGLDILSGTDNLVDYDSAAQSLVTAVKA